MAPPLGAFNVWDTHSTVVYDMGFFIFSETDKVEQLPWSRTIQCRYRIPDLDSRDTVVLKKKNFFSFLFFCAEI